MSAKDQPIITTCAGGHRGAMAMAALQMLGYTNVKSMGGGIRGWKRANLPVATGTPAMPAVGKAPDVDRDLFAAFDRYFSAMPDGWGAIQAPAANDQVKATKTVLIDLRESSEYASGGYIEGSINISIRSLLKSDKLPADKAAPIIVTCASGHRGGIATMALQMIGYTNVKSIVNGLNGWKAANLPIVGGSPASR